jgi:hypothetical protein
VIALLIPFHEKSDTDVKPESFAASKFFNCELRIANCELVLAANTGRLTLGLQMLPKKGRGQKAEGRRKKIYILPSATFF